MKPSPAGFVDWSLDVGELSYGLDHLKLQKTVLAAICNDIFILSELTRLFRTPALQGEGPTGGAIEEARVGFGFASTIGALIVRVGFWEPL